MNENKKIGLAVASMILGIISLLFGCCFWYVSLPAALVSIALASVSLAKKNDGKGMAIAGLVTSIVSLVPAVIIFLTGTSLTAVLASSDEDSETTKKSDISISDSAEKFNENSDNSENSVTISDSWIEKDYSGNDIFVVEYEWTNTGDDTASFTFAVVTKAYQNGVEIETAYGCDSVDSSDSLKDIQPGTTLKVREAFELEDKTEVNIVVKELFGDEILNETIKLNFDESPTEETSIEKTANNNSEDNLSIEQIKNDIENGNYSNVTPEFKVTMDSYETFYNNYFDFMTKYNSEEANVLDMLDDYTKMLADLEKWTSQINAINTNELSTADSAYFLLVTSRIEKKLIDMAL